MTFELLFLLPGAVFGLIVGYIFLAEVGRWLFRREQDRLPLRLDDEGFTAIRRNDRIAQFEKELESGSQEAA